MSGVTEYEGTFRVSDTAQFALVASRFNHFVVDRLVEGAVDALRRHGVSESRIVLVKTPGAWELPLAVQRCAKSGRFAGVVALSAVIRGSTPHFDYVAGQAAVGCAKSMLETHVPVAFGVLTTDTIEQAVERSGTKAGNKGWEAALAVLEMVSLDEALTGDGI